MVNDGRGVRGRLFPVIGLWMDASQQGSTALRGEVAFVTGLLIDIHGFSVGPCALMTTQAVGLVVGPAKVLLRVRFDPY